MRSGDLQGRRKARGAAERSAILLEVPTRPAEGANAEAEATADMATTVARKDRENIAADFVFHSCLNLSDTSPCKSCFFLIACFLWVTSLLI